LPHAAENARQLIGERALRESEARLRLLFQNMLDGFAYCWMVFDERDRPVDFVYLEVNAAFEKLTGLRDVVGKKVSEVIPGIRESEPELLETYGRVARTGQPERFEMHFRPLDLWLAIAVYSPQPDYFVAVFDNITDRKRAEEALRRERQLVDSVTKATDVMLVYLDRDFTFVWVNDAYAATCQMRPEALIGKNHFAVYPHAENEAIFRRVRDSGEPVFYKDKPFEFPDQPERGVTYWDWSLVPVREAGGPVLGLVFSLRETTKYKQAELALRAARERLADANRRKDEFLGMLSHELRNPLAPIRNSVYILERAAPAGEQATRARQVIERQTEHLARLVDDLLDVTRIARGKIELRRSRVDLRELVRRTAEDLRSVVESRGVTLGVEVTAEKLWADADATRIAQVIGNLLQNAAKFTRAGDTVTLSLRSSGDRAEVSVRDTGAGIEPGLLPEVFEAFVQGDRTLARTDGGLGLGLALVKGITELHGGTVRAESAGMGKGAEFVVRLPLAPAAAPARHGPGAAVRGSSTGRRVLIVDDSQDAADSLAEIVQLMGHTTEVAYDGPSALEKARTFRPNVVLCDIGLPGMSGYEVAKALRALGPIGLQLVAVSGYAQPEDVKAAVEAGFDTHVAKPPSPTDVERILG
jgi:PAS domain S-box-containing protein